ncbi:MAG: 3-isopropylmalate dehydratase small subunit [Candidatus Hadarchaeota archaeon]
MAKAWVYGDDISTDLIIPGRYLIEREPEKLAEHAMEGADENFSDTVEQGDVVVAGRNFGCGSSREHAPIALKAAGVSAVIAESFARIFYRNAINQGIPVLTLEKANEKFDTGDEVEIAWKEGRIENLTREEKYETDPLPTLLANIVKEGGLMKKLKRNRSS